MAPLRGVVDGDDRVVTRFRRIESRRIHRGVPAEDRPVLGREKEDCRRAVRYAGCADSRNHERVLRRRNIEDQPRRCAAGAERFARRRNRHHSRLRCSCRVVQRRNAGAGVGDPEGRGCRFADTPGIEKVGIHERGLVHDAVRVGQHRLVGDEIGLDHAAGKRRTGRARDCGDRRNPAKTFHCTGRVGLNRGERCVVSGAARDGTRCNHERSSFASVTAYPASAVDTRTPLLRR